MSEGVSFVRHGPAAPATPLVLSVPHAGRDYPEALTMAARIPRERLEALEDRHADRLIDPLAARGITAFVATRARAWIDLNRDPADLDPGMVAPAPPVSSPLSRRVRSGLGLVPRRLAGVGEIYARPLPLADIRARIAGEHAPWHDAIGAALLAARARFGVAILVECHSMPPLGGDHAARVVIGDRFGLSAGREFVDAVCAVVRVRNVPVAINAPYAGAYTLERHGDPRDGVHALQIEFCRSLYLDAGLRGPGPGLGATQTLMDAIGSALLAASERGMLAAE